MHLFIERRGSSVIVRNQMFVVKNPDQQTAEFAPRVVRSITLGKAVSITTDAIILANKHDIPLFFNSFSGKPEAMIWNFRFGSIATIRKNQLRFAQTTHAFLWTAQTINKRVNSQILFANKLIQSNSTKRTERSLELLSKIHDTIAYKILHFPKDFENIAPSLRGWEGIASKYYFTILANALPPEYQFKERSRKPALDYFNALLNYFYGILYARVERALIYAGLDPAIGILHADQYNTPVFTFDFIEPYRIWADKVALRLLSQLPFSEAKLLFQPLEIKGYALNLEGKKYFVPYFLEYLDMTIQTSNYTRSRQTHIFLEAQQFAQKMLTFKH